MKILLGLFFVLCFSLSGFAQSDLLLIGKVSDLAGKKKVYISAETTDSRKLIQKVFDKDKTFEIVSDAEKADFVIEYKVTSKESSMYGNSGDTGEMTVYFFNTDKRKVNAWSETKNYFKKGWGLPKANETFLTTQFLKAIKKVI